MPITVTAPRVNWLEELTVESQPPDCLKILSTLEYFGKSMSYSGSRALITNGQVVFPAVLTSTKRYRV